MKNLNRMNKNQLQEYGKTLGCTLDNAMTKKTMIQELVRFNKSQKKVKAQPEQKSILTRVREFFKL